MGSAHRCSTASEKEGFLPDIRMNEIGIAGMALVYDEEVKTADILFPFRLLDSPLEGLRHSAYHLLLRDILIMGIDIFYVYPEIFDSASVLIQNLASVGYDENLSVKGMLLSGNITEAYRLPHAARGTEKNPAILVERSPYFLHSLLLVCSQFNHTLSISIRCQYPDILILACQFAFMYSKVISSPYTSLAILSNSSSDSPS